jgi:2-polyprenyl-6-methoxyphenol hydroxylase-like FAD-dependent oxidoreductase
MDKNTMSSQLPVLIIGAGPTGLMMACELARHEISFRIIDKKPESTPASNATWVQTRTIELLDHIGIADRFLRNGHQCNSINLHTNSKSVAKIALNDIDSIYPFILMLPQSKTEILLTQRLEELNNRVERSLELIEIKQENNTVISTIKHPDGQIENITSNWLIACDGANSKVRESCNLFFSGKDLPEQFVVADARMNSHLPNDEIHMFFDKGTLFPDRATILATFPWGSKEYRVTANIYQGHARQTFTAIEVKEAMNERAYANYTVDSVSWISPFWIHSKIVDNMRHDSIFLAGDAAHVHSPAGGQGMNTGMQDAYNLAWKLALVIKNKAAPSLLDTYHSERHPVVKYIVDQTEHFTNMALFDKSFTEKLNDFGRALMNNKESLSKKIGMRITQLDIQYQDSPIINHTESDSKNSLQQGMRAPDVLISPSNKLYKYFNNTLHNILLFTGEEITKNELAQIMDLQQWLNQKFSGLIRTHIIANEKSDIPNSIVDSNNMIHKKYQVEQPAIYIIRPDTYIAYCSNKFDHASIENIFMRYLLNTNS